MDKQRMNELGPRIEELDRELEDASIFRQSHQTQPSQVDRKLKEYFSSRIELEKKMRDRATKSGRTVKSVTFDGEGVTVEFEQNRRDMGRILRWNDLVPSPVLRKKLLKMIGDQERHIRSLESAGRVREAEWQYFWTVLFFFWFTLLQPVVSVAKSIRGKSSLG